MAATLRIQSDWSQALRWELPLGPFPAPISFSRPRGHRRSFSPQEG